MPDTPLADPDIRGVNAVTRRNRGLILIAVFKFSKVAILMLSGFGALQLLRPEVAQGARDWATELAMEDERRVLQYLLETAGSITTPRLKAFGIASAIYAALFFVEGIGLLLQRRWAEYLTVAAGISLIPIELYELYRHVGPIKIAVLLLNIAVVWYLIRRLKANRAMTARSTRLSHPEDRR